MRQLFLPLFVLSLVFVFFTLVWFGFNVYLGTNHAYEQLDKEAAKQTENNTGQTSTQSTTKPRAKPQTAPPSLQHAAPSDLPEAADAEALMARAEAGDVKAQLAMMELFDLCANWSIMKGIHAMQDWRNDPESTIHGYLKNTPMGMQAFERIHTQNAVICGQAVIASELAPGVPTASGLTAQKKWMNKAAEQGNLVARVNALNRSPQSDTTTKQLLNDIVEAQDTDALLHFAILGNMMDEQLSINRQLKTDDPEWDAALWSMAACRLGARGCGADARWLRQTCMHIYDCGYPSLEAMLMDTTVPPARRMWAEQRIQAIMDAYRSGDVWETEQTDP